MNRKMMNLGIGLCFACMAALTAASCTDDTDDGSRLPDGACPMTFTASVDGLTATRATTDNNGKTTWQAEDPVAISMDGGANHKQYKISDANTGAMIPDGDGNILYWSKRQETLAAWYPVSYTVGSNTGSGEVDITDQNTGFGALENILHAPAQDYTYSSSNPVAFTFRHALAKVKVTLKKGDGITDDDLSAATVTFTGYTAGSLGYNGMTGSGSNGDITPKTETASGGAPTYTALVIPQQMQSKKFIKVTIGADGAARNYFYTPAGSTDANLEAGKQYTYTITVKKTGLQVESVTASWKDDSAKDGDAEKATFRIHLADFSAPTNTSDYKVTDANGTTLTANDNIYTTSSSAINISLSADDGYTLRKFLTKVTAGICKQKVAYTADTRTYTYTFYDIHSDLWLDNIQAEAGAAGTSPASPNVGDYFYANGTWSSTYSSNTSNPCIGIVFKVGAGAGDNVGNYNFFFMDNTIHGYVVALNDANDNAGAWGIRLTNVDGLTDEGSYVNKYDGYSNTAIVRLLKAYKSTDVNSPTADGQYWVFKVASGYSAISPANTSGWYLPSIGQLNDIYSMNNRTGLFQGAGGTDFKTTDNNGRYWSSTEKNEYDAWYYQFNGSGSGSYAKSDNGYLRVSYVRAILTF